MNWGKWIVTAFVLFALFVGTLVTVSLRQDITLVTREYYKEELAYQEQLERKQNANRLEEKPDLLVVDNERLEVRYRDLKSVRSGVVTLFRPSDAALDHVFVLQATEDTVLRFPLEAYEKGLYKARMRWTMNGKEYFIEKIIVL
jgi:hypothetical protein